MTAGITTTPSVAVIRTGEDMRCFGTMALAVVCLGLCAVTGAAEELTLDQALALARARAPSVVAAQLAIQESRARLIGASVLLRSNPVLDGAAGPRLRGGGGESLEARLGFSQAFELGGQRGARISAAEADIARAGAGAARALRVALRDVCDAFYRALHATQSLEFAGKARATAVDIVNVAERRLAAGDIARLDVNLAQAARSRADATVLDASCTAGGLKVSTSRQRTSK